MNHLALQKQLLVAESELNRVELKRELGELAADLHALTAKTNTLSTLVTSAKVVLSSLIAIHQVNRADHGEKPSWWRSLRQELSLVTALWKAFSPLARSHHRDQ